MVPYCPSAGPKAILVPHVYLLETIEHPLARIGWRKGTLTDTGWQWSEEKHALAPSGEGWDCVGEAYAGSQQHLYHVVHKIRRLRDAAGARKLAIVCYNYPPGEANVFGGRYAGAATAIRSCRERSCIGERDNVRK
ncbi:hypothetical protein [Cohnella sp. 56]|uniref:hypothetical protein n=1 Tax=Cohnella sp. 56 TaxID=3113722 RepID=UPI0030E7C5B6